MQHAIDVTNAPRSYKYKKKWFIFMSVYIGYVSFEIHIVYSSIKI